MNEFWRNLIPQLWKTPFSVFQGTLKFVRFNLKKEIKAANLSINWILNGEIFIDSWWDNSDSMKDWPSILANEGFRSDC